MLTALQQDPTPEQRTIISEELGREPKGMQYVTALDSQGRPLVVQVDALVDDKPFPTLYWLSSRLLVKELSHLEAAGVIKKLEARLLEDEQLLSEYRKSHEDYIQRRWDAMSAETRQRVADLGFTEVFSRRGVGGIENWQQVRCLHTQYAHHLSGYNAIGQWLDQEYGIKQLIP
ncbi:DUF501 domain-containing protein [Marinospirillum sp.]|uniref:DUF501 domain-containing protein n=1 Tax=Marinospirillum sp. TaxID=2183934 RepID=UPI00287029F7|nr:DUF501 domain-containing protein [Marinospirillum sp.]MDR9467979.1 DUF501 domain-containing protein [Marinospirillum sp.]